MGETSRYLNSVILSSVTLSSVFDLSSDVSAPRTQGKIFR